MKVRSGRHFEVYAMHAPTSAPVKIGDDKGFISTLADFACESLAATCVVCPSTCMGKGEG